MGGRFVAALLILAGASDVAFAQGKPDEMVMQLYMVESMVEGCKESEALLRKTCARVGPGFPEKDKQLCALPAQTFATRYERDYQAFRQRYREEFRIRQAEIETMIQSDRRRSGGPYASMERGGSFTMLELSMLSKDTAESCRIAERLLLRATTRK